MKKTQSYYDLLNIFNEILYLYKTHFDKCSFNEFTINDFERVYVVEDSFIIYIGMKFDDEELDVHGFYPIIFEEFTENTVFKFSINSFINSLYKKYNPQELYFDYLYKKFHGILDEPVKIVNEEYFKQIEKDYTIPEYYQSNFKRVNNLFPELKLIERYNNWEGFSTNYIIYELKLNGKVGYAVCSTTNNNTTQYAIRKEQDLEMGGYDINRRYSLCGKIIATSYNGVFINQNMAEILCNIIKKTEDDNRINIIKNVYRTSYLSGRVKYFVINKFHKTPLSCNDILTELANGKYKNYERQLFELGQYKWKSEELVLKYVTQIFKTNKVIHQHRPYFLHSSKGQLSYDVFVSGKNIAFEYQGKQHFEPVSIFGGVENFKKQQERDLLKKELSEKNNIKLIYINYWENITKQLIIDKLKENGINK